MARDGIGMWRVSSFVLPNRGRRKCYLSRGRVNWEFPLRLVSSGREVSGLV